MAPNKKKITDWSKVEDGALATDSEDDEAHAQGKKAEQRRRVQKLAEERERQKEMWRMQRAEQVCRLTGVT
jgi:hypothetical protein